MIPSRERLPTTTLLTLRDIRSAAILRVEGGYRVSIGAGRAAFLPPCAALTEVLSTTYATREEARDAAFVVFENALLVPA